MAGVGRSPNASQPSGPGADDRAYASDHVSFLGAVVAYSYNRQEPLLFARGSYGGFLPADGGPVSKR
jgi:hypothetical protein